MKNKERFFYAVGGIGHNLIYALFSGFLLILYTDVFGLSPSFTAVLFLLDVIGYVPNVDQTAGVLNALHGFMSLLPGILFLLAAVVLFFYPMNQAQFAELQAALKARRDGA